MKTTELGCIFQIIIVIFTYFVLIFCIKLMFKIFYFNMFYLIIIINLKNNYV